MHIENKCDEKKFKTPIVITTRREWAQTHILCRHERDETKWAETAWSSQELEYVGYTLANIYITNSSFFVYAAMHI